MSLGMLDVLLNTNMALSFLLRLVTNSQKYARLRLNQTWMSKGHMFVLGGRIT